MFKKLKTKIFLSVICLLLLTGIIWQGFYLYKYTRNTSSLTGFRSLRVKVDGNVRRPGLYQIPEGTTQFEILKVAGVRPTSDLSGFVLANQLEENSTINVGTLDNPVQIQNIQTQARLEFYLGEVSIIASDGSNTPIHEGLVVSKGSRILTEASAQAEISIGPNSRIDVDNFSELVLDKISEIENNRSTTELFQKSGTCWYRTVYTKSDSELIRVAAPFAFLTVGGSGADFLVDIQNDQIQVNLLDGLLLLEHTDNTDAINLISGQSVTIYKDGRPFEVTRLSADLNANSRFSQLNREKINYMSRLMPFNFLFCGTPGIFYVISIQHETNVFHVIRVPSELLIEHFAQGIATLDEAFLYGGPVFANTFLERILEMQIPKYCVFDKSDIMRTTNSLGGIQVLLDSKAASVLNMASGSQKLIGKNLLLFLSPSISGIDDSYYRQSQFFESLFNGFRNKTLTMTLLLAEQILTNTETNLMPFELMEQFSKFNSRNNWKFKEHNLPVQPVKRNNQVRFEPILDKCKILLKQE